VTSAVGFLVVAAVGLARCRSVGIRVEYAADAVIAAALAGLVGARGMYLLGADASLGDPLAWVDLRSGGMSFYGALLLSIPVASGVAALRGVPVLAGWDAFATGLPFGFAISRLGCLAAGCCYGLPTSLPWGVQLPALPGPVHPTQLYEAAWQLGLGVALDARWRRRGPPGELALIWLGGTALGRFAIEFWRGDPGRGALGPLSGPQALSLLALASAGIGIALLRSPIGLRRRR
jgi:phosphatidylglycerol:prolipoprotein diacylglycerol transferase